MTNPSLLLSNGMQAVFGSGFLDSAIAACKSRHRKRHYGGLGPSGDNSVCISVLNLPVCLSRLHVTMSRMLLPTGSVGPLALNTYRHYADEHVDYHHCNHKGDTFRGPSDIKPFCCSVLSGLLPPIPEPIYSPSRRESMSRFILLSSTACAAAAKAYCYVEIVLFYLTFFKVLQRVQNPLPRQPRWTLKSLYQFLLSSLSDTAFDSFSSFLPSLRPRLMRP
jgi:hypothetical protein